MTVMKVVVHDSPEGIYPPVSVYAHGIEVQRPERLLFVSGTMGLDVSGAPGVTLAAQLDLIWSNIRAILESADMSLDNIVRTTSYLRDTAYVEENARMREAVLGRRLIATTTIVAQTLKDDWLVEIEVIAAA